MRVLVRSGARTLNLAHSSADADALPTELTGQLRRLLRRGKSKEAAEKPSERGNSHHCDIQMLMSESIAELHNHTVIFKQNQIRHPNHYIINKCT